MADQPSRLERARAALNLPPAPDPHEEIKWDDIFIPDPGSDFSPEDDELERFTQGIDILDAYARWIGKMQPKVGNKRESIMISCPMPNHTDTHPSAWVNLDKQTWYCGACNIGGDQFDLAAIHFGYDPIGYKNDGSFPKLKRDMAQDFGWVVTKTAGITSIEPPAPLPEPSSEPTPANLLVLPNQPDPNDTGVEFAELDWTKIVQEDTFLYEWMKSTTTDSDLPDEYYLFLGLVALGFFAGDNVILNDRHPIKGNLFVCLFGPTGIGKSRSIKALSEALYSFLPWNGQPNNTGVQHVPMPGSSEALVDAFSMPVEDPTDPKKIVGYAPVRGFVHFDELASLISRAQRRGSDIKAALMKFYDGDRQISIVSRGSGTVRADRPFCSTVTTTQPRAIRSLVLQEDADSGFLNRWLFISGKPKPLISYGGKRLDLSPVEPYARSLRGWTGKHRAMALKDTALDAWDSFFRDNIEPLKLRGENELTVRLDLTLKKLILLLAVNKKEDDPSLATVYEALAFYPYLRKTYEMLSSQIGVGPMEDCANWLAEKLVEYERDEGHPPTLDEVLRKWQYGKKRFGREVMRNTLKLMEDLGEIRSIAPPKTTSRGRPKGPSYQYLASA